MSACLTVCGFIGSVRIHEWLWVGAGRERIEGATSRRSGGHREREGVVQTGERLQRETRTGAQWDTASQRDCARSRGQAARSATPSLSASDLFCCVLSCCAARRWCVSVSRTTPRGDWTQLQRPRRSLDLAAVCCSSPPPHSCCTVLALLHRTTVLSPHCSPWLLLLLPLCPVVAAANRSGARCRLRLVPLLNTRSRPSRRLSALASVPLFPGRCSLTDRRLQARATATDRLRSIWSVHRSLQLPS